MASRRRGRLPAVDALARARSRRRASSTRSTSRSATSTRRDRTVARDAPLSRRQARRAGRDRRGARAAASARATSTTRASRASSPRTARCSTSWGADRIERRLLRARRAGRRLRARRGRGARPRRRARQRRCALLQRRFPALAATTRASGDRALRRARAQGLRPSSWRWEAMPRRSARRARVTARLIAPSAPGTTIQGSERLAREAHETAANTADFPGTHDPAQSRPRPTPQRPHASAATSLATRPAGIAGALTRRRLGAPHSGFATCASHGPSRRYPNGSVSARAGCPGRAEGRGTPMEIVIAAARAGSGARASAAGARRHARRPARRRRRPRGRRAAPAPAGRRHRR